MWKKKKTEQYRPNLDMDKDELALTWWEHTLYCTEAGYDGSVEWRKEWLGLANEDFEKLYGYTTPGDIIEHANYVYSKTSNNESFRDFIKRRDESEREKRQEESLRDQHYWAREYLGELYQEIQKLVERQEEETNNLVKEQWAAWHRLNQLFENNIPLEMVENFKDLTTKEISAQQRKHTSELERIDLFKELSDAERSLNFSKQAALHALESWTRAYSLDPEQGIPSSNEAQQFIDQVQIPGSRDNNPDFER